MERKPPQDTESRHADKYIVRFPDGMRDELKAAAKASGRTLNAEIVARLQETLRPGSRKIVELVEDTVVVSDELLTPQLLKIVETAAAAAAEKVLAKRSASEK